MIENIAVLALGNSCLRGGIEILNQLVYEVEQEVEELQEHMPQEHELDPSSIPSPTLARLIEEVRNEDVHTAHAYNRMHNRHNRSR
jgi:hypothetical protein